jgi:hypothetical protein
MDRCAFKRVVEILAMDGGAIDQRGRRNIEFALMAYCGARALAIAGGDSGLNVVLVPGGDHQPARIEQGSLQHAPDRVGNAIRSQTGSPGRKALRGCRLVLVHGR